MPIASATSCWVSSNSCCRRCSAAASSMGFRSSLWIFSIRAMAMAASSGTSRTIVGMLCRPASWVARQRRSPAMISYLLSEMGRTTMGCMTPWALMLSARSCSDSGSMSRRGWYLPRWIRSTGSSLRTPSPSCSCPSPAAGGVGLAPAPSRASSPRPNPRFLPDIRILRSGTQPAQWPAAVGRVFPRAG